MVSPGRARSSLKRRRGSVVIVATLRDPESVEVSRPPTDPENALFGNPATDSAAAAGASRRAIARLIGDLLHGGVAHGARGGHPVQDLRCRGLQLVARQRRQDLTVGRGQALERQPVDVLVYGE